MDLKHPIHNGITTRFCGAQSGTDLLAASAVGPFRCLPPRGCGPYGCGNGSRSVRRARRPLRPFPEPRPLAVAPPVRGRDCAALRRTSAARP